MTVRQIKEHIRRAEYQVDPDAVACAIIARVAVSVLPAPPPVSEGVLVARGLEARSPEPHA